MKFREYKTSFSNLVLLGKSSENNEELIKQAKSGELLLHTSKPGSPFVNLKSDSAIIDKKEIYEVAIMCAKHSKDWRDNKKDVSVHYFFKNDVYKEKDMKEGSFGVKKFKEIKVKKEDILKFEKELENVK